MKRVFTTIAVALCLGGCVVTDLGAERQYITLVAPGNLKGGPVPYWIGEWDPWSIRRAEGCLAAGEQRSVTARQKGPSLMVRVPAGSVTLSGQPRHVAEKRCAVSLCQRRWH